MEPREERPGRRERVSRNAPHPLRWRFSSVCADRGPVGRYRGFDASCPTPVRGCGCRSRAARRATPERLPGRHGPARALPVDRRASQPTARARTRLIERKTVAEVPLTGLSLRRPRAACRGIHRPSPFSLRWSGALAGLDFSGNTSILSPLTQRGITLSQKGYNEMRYASTLLVAACGLLLTQLSYGQSTIYVSSGAFSSPPYLFYSDSARTQPLDIYTGGSASLLIGQTYTFTGGSGSHPFYMSNLGVRTPPSSLISLVGNGSATSGITGTSQSFTLSFNRFQSKRRHADLLLHKPP